MGCGSSAGAKAAETPRSIDSQPISRKKTTSMSSVKPEVSSQTDQTTEEDEKEAPKSSMRKQDAEVMANPDQSDSTNNNQSQNTDRSPTPKEGDEMNTIMKIYDMTAELNASLEEKNRILLEQIRAQKYGDQYQVEMIKRHLEEMTKIRADLFRQRSQQDNLLLILLNDGQNTNLIGDDIENEISLLDVGMIQILREKELLSPEELGELLRAHRDSQEEIIRSKAAPYSQKDVQASAKALNTDFTEAMRQKEENFMNELESRRKNGEDVDELIAGHLEEVKAIRKQKFAERSRLDDKLNLLLGARKKKHSQGTDEGFEDEMARLDQALEDKLKGNSDFSAEEASTLLEEHRKKQQELLTSRATQTTEADVQSTIFDLEKELTEAHTHEDEKFLEEFLEKRNKKEDVNELLQRHLENVKAIRTQKLAEKSRLNDKLSKILAEKRPRSSKVLRDDIQQEIDDIDKDLYEKLSSKKNLSTSKAAKLFSEHHNKQKNILTSRATQTSTDEFEASIDDFTTELYGVLQANDSSLINVIKNKAPQGSDNIEDLLKQHLADVKAIRGQKFSERSRLDEKMKNLIGNKKKEVDKEEMADDIEQEIEEVEDKLVKQLQAGEKMSIEDIDGLLQEHQQRQADIIKTRAVQKSKLDEKLKQKLLENKRQEKTEVTFGKKELLVEQLHGMRASSSISNEEFYRLLKHYMTEMAEHQKDLKLQKEEDEQREIEQSNMERERETTKMLKDNEENIKRIQNLRVKEKTLLDLKLDEKKKKKKSIEIEKRAASATQPT